MWPFSRKKTVEEKVGEMIKSEAPDFAHLFGNLSNRDKAAVLYKELSVLLHPDRFIGSDEKTVEQAEALFKELSNCRTDINKLLTLKDKSEQFISEQ